MFVKLFLLVNFPKGKGIDFVEKLTGDEVVENG